MLVDRVLIFDLFTLNKPYCHVKPPVKVQICIKYIKLNIASHKTRDGKSQLFDVLSHKISPESCKLHHCPWQQRDGGAWQNSFPGYERHIRHAGEESSRR